MNLLITGAWLTAKSYINQIEKLGHNVIFQQQEKEKLVVGYDWVEGIIGNGIFLSHPIENFSNLKYLQLTSAGYDRVPMNYVKKHNIKIYNARGVYSIPMAEFAISGVLQLYKQARFFSENQEKHKWIKHRGLLELNGKSVCIIGCGSVGTECAKRFAAFGCNVVGVDLNPREDKAYQEIVGLNELNGILPETDILILTLPLTKDTYYLINDSCLDKLKQGAVLVNIARGSLIDSNALINHIGKLEGAVLDVFEEEPLNFNSSLWNMKNVIISPHNSFVGENNQKRLSDLIMRNLEGR